MDTLSLVFDHGMKLSGGILGFDRPDAGLCFISSAEVPAAWKARKPLCTELTAGLLRAVRREFRPLVMPFGRPTVIGPIKVTLHPAGPMPGSALIVVEHAGRRLMYCAGLPDSSVRIPACDILAAQVVDEDANPDFSGKLLKSVRCALGAGLLPVIRCNQFGVARAVCAALSAGGVMVRQHRGIFRFNGIWRAMGYDQGLCRRLNGRSPAGSVVVIPPNVATERLVSADVHPWVISVARQSDVSDTAHHDERIVIGGAISPNDLCDLVARTGAVEVALYGSGGSAAAGMLAGRGIAVTVLDSVHQCVLQLS